MLQPTPSRPARPSEVTPAPALRLAVRVHSAGRNGLLSISPDEIAAGVLIGHGDDCGIRFDPRRDAVAKHHAILIQRGPGILLQDLGGRGDLFVDAKRVPTGGVYLRPGSRVQLGRVGPVLVIDLPAEDARPAPRPELRVAPHPTPSPPPLPPPPAPQIRLVPDPPPALLAGPALPPEPAPLRADPELLELEPEGEGETEPAAIVPGPMYGRVAPLHVPTSDPWLRRMMYLVLACACVLAAARLIDDRALRASEAQRLEARTARSRARSTALGAQAQGARSELERTRAALRESRDALARVVAAMWPQDGPPVVDEAAVRMASARRAAAAVERDLTRALGETR